MTRTTPIRRHAITPPVFGREKLHRQRLVEILKANLDRRLIFIVAPAGYGKTTLMADLTAHIDRPVCWVRVTEHDRDPARLWRVVIESLGAKFRRMRRQLDARGLESLSADKIGGWIGRQIGESGAPPFALMFDDVHLLGGSSESTALVAGLIDALPEHVCCILGGREALELPLARAVAANEVLSIGAGDLSFAEDELEAWLNLDGEGEPSAEVLERLMSESRGWIAGIQLLRLRGLEALQGSVPSPKELTFDYFGSEVLGRQSDALQKFALESSVLPVMTAEAVEAVCRVEDGARWLRLAVRKGLFLLGTSSSPRTYEYHPLFREFLQKRIEASDSKRARAAKIRAAKFLAKRGEAEQAVELYWEADLPYDALRVAERTARKMRIEGRVDTLLRWNNLLRQKGISSSGILLRLSFLFGEMGRIGEAYRFWREGANAEDLNGRHAMDFRLQRMRIDLARGHTRAVMLSTRKLMKSARFSRMQLHDRAEVMNMYANILLETSGDLSEALSYSRRSKYLLRKNDAFWRTGAVLTYWACVGYAGLREEAVKCELASEKLSKLFISQGERVGILTNLAWDAALDGRFEDALGLLDQAMRIGEDLGLTSDKTLVFINLGDLYSDVGRPREALHYYDGALGLSRAGASPSWVRYARLRKASALRRIGRYSLARREIRRLRRLKSDSWSREIEIEFLALQALRMPKLALGKMMKLTKRPLGAAPRTILEAHIVRTMMTLGDRDGARSRLKDLLPTARKTWAVLPLAGEMSKGSAILSLARACANSDATLHEVEAYMSRGMALPRVPNEARGYGVDALRLDIQAFGDFRVSLFGQQLKVKRKALEFLLYVVDNGGVAQERAIDDFWGHLAQESQSANLHSTVYALRRMLGKYALLTQNGVLRLAPTLHVDYDVGEFTSSALIAGKKKGSPAERVAVLKRAAQLYRGPFAQAIGSDWAAARRTELQNTFVTLCLDLAESCTVAGVPSKAIPHLKLALLWEPYREDVATALLQCLASAGRAAEALQSGLEYSAMLQSQGGVRPRPEFQWLLGQLSSGHVFPDAINSLVVGPS